jgi:hypothetical protein
MDLLLRNMPKRTSSVSEPSNGGQQTAHLDADELNAFAEHSLPSAARTRYTAHLVDCSRCRKLVAELSAAAGLPRAESITDREVHTSFWQRLPAFLSPSVLRFALPALAILGVITVAMITFRQSGSSSFVARQVEAPNAANSPVPSETQLDSVVEPGQTPAATNPAPAAQANSASAKESKADVPNEQSKGVTLDGLTTGDSSAGVAVKDADKSGTLAGEKAQPKFAPEPSPPAPAAVAAAQPQATATAEVNKNEAIAKQKEQDAEGVREVQEERRPAKDSGDFLSRSRKAATAGRGGVGVSSSPARRDEAEQDKRSNQSEETREVAGRRFRKQGNSWVDSAYGGGRLVMTVVRGSEQYRVLIADEPGIRTIAESLGGEVIVVWKGRAYRIR